MATPDKVEAVKKVTETLNQNAEERLAPNKDHFDNLMHTAQTSVNPTSFERIDTKAFSADEVQRIETQPAFGDENVSAQKGGTATDQEGKRKQQQGNEVEGVSERS
jgi:hypothetical protein